MVGILRLRRGGFRMEPDGSTVVDTFDDHYRERVVTRNAGLGPAGELLDLVDCDLDRLGLVVFAPLGIASAVLFIEVWAQKSFGNVDHDEACRDGEIMRTVHGEVAGVLFVVESRQCALVCRHARLGLESHEHVADIGLVQCGQFLQFEALLLRQLDLPVIGEGDQRSLALCGLARRLADDEVQVL